MYKTDKRMQLEYTMCITGKDTYKTCNMRQKMILKVCNSYTLSAKNFV